MKEKVDKHFLGALTMIFVSYPAKLGHALVNPLTGIPSRLKFLTIAEVREEFERAMPQPPAPPSAPLLALEAARTKQLTERLEAEKWERENPASRRRQVVAEAWKQGARQEVRGNGLAPLEGWEERAAGWGMVNTPASELMEKGLFAKPRSEERWD